jgi:PhzF family phenazine biosynthesis protein
MKLLTQRNVWFVRVFVGQGGQGGNPAPIVLEASDMSDAEMLQFAESTGHESAFVLRPTDSSVGADFRMRYFVPAHEMEMCGHATVGALWALRQAGVWRSSRATIETRSGLVHGFLRHAGTDGEAIEITQPRGQLQAIDDAAIADILQVLNISREQCLPLPVLNASTSRVKTLVPLASVECLDQLRPDFSRMKQLCERIGSTGLYPFAIESLQQRVFHARQFPKSSGYPEDAATGIAAAALLYGLRAHELVASDEGIVTVHQGLAMGSPSRIRVRFNLGHEGQPDGCFISGSVLPAVH